MAEKYASFLEAAEAVATSGDSSEIFDLYMELFVIFNLSLFGHEVSFSQLKDADLMVLMLCFAEAIVAEGEVPPHEY